MMKRPPFLHHLLSYLAEKRPITDQFHHWHIQKIDGSANNLLYRVGDETADFAVKFTIRDARRRAYREYQALTALQEAAPGLAPRPILMDETSYPLPVVVQTWLEGVVTAVPPQTDREWEHLVRHYATLAHVLPENVNVPLPPAVTNFASLNQAHQIIQQQIACIPTGARPATLQNLLARLASAGLPPCPAAPSLALCRNDSNTLNFIRQPDRWVSVDWEYSGWGDPAFEVVDVICHPRYASVSQARWEWVIGLYGELVADKTAVTRLRAYLPFMYVWWVARLARAAYEVPRGLDQRLVERPSDWQAQNQALYEQYGALAETALARLG